MELILALVAVCTLVLAEGPIQVLVVECMQVQAVALIRGRVEAFTLGRVEVLIAVLAEGYMLALEAACTPVPIQIPIRQSIQRGLFLLWN